MIDVKEITELHRQTVERWHDDGIHNPYEGFLRLVCEQHERNYRLWHQEDLARSPNAQDVEIAEVKRRIDRLNQARNDFIEKLDDCLIYELATRGVKPRPDAALNTETPGSTIDRLSILALRIYHMQEQSARADADPKHRMHAQGKRVILDEQHRDLSTSLRELVNEIRAGRKRLKVYRQFKMYNDPTMNPYLYGEGKKPAA